MRCHEVGRNPVASFIGAEKWRAEFGLDMSLQNAKALRTVGPKGP